MEQWIHEVALAVRRLRQQPGFALTAVATLALGLGANIAIFTLVYGISYQPLPVRAPHELVRLGDDNNCCVNSGLQERYSLFSNDAYHHLKSGLPELEPLTAFQANTAATAVRRAGSNLSDSVPSQYVTANYFETFGVRAAQGRLLEESDDRSDAMPVFVVSYRYWRDTLAADPSAVGAAFVVGGTTMTMVGVTEPSFFGETRRPEPTDLWLPMGQEPVMRTSGSLVTRPETDWLRVIGRLRPGASLQAVETSATMLMRQWLQGQSFVSDDARDRARQVTVPVVSAAAGVELMRFGFQQQLLVLFVMSAFVLLVAAANLANLLLARADRGQAAIRVALGASSGRLVRQALIEGVVLSLLGAAAGLLVAALSTRAIVALAFPTMTMVPIDLSPSPVILAFAVGLAVLTGALFAAAPAVAAARTAPMDVLRGVGRGGGHVSAVPRRALVVLQVALSCVLLSGAGLLMRSLQLLETQPLGFEPDGRVVARLEIPATYAGDLPRLDTLFRTLRERLTQVSGVRDMTFALYTPMEGNNWSGRISIDGVEETADQPLGSSWNRVAPGFFDVLGTRIVRGRGFADNDGPSSPRVAIVNSTFAQRYFRDAEPLGQRVGIGANRARDYTIVGVSEDVKFSNPQLPTRPMIFLPAFQLVDYDAESASTQARSTLMRMLVLRTNGPTGRLEGDIRNTLAEVDPNLTLVRVTTMEAQVAGNYRMNRLLAILTSAYGVLALGLATLGLYAVTAYFVATRRREIGVRMALGAERSRIVRDVVLGAVAQTAVGLAVGIPAALLASRAIASQLYSVTTRDPLVLGGAVVVLLAAAVLSAAAPARRAASVNPTTVLRGD